MTQEMETSNMTEEESYRFDISGFIVVRGVLLPDELATYNKAFDRVLDGDADLPQSAAYRYPFLQLRDHPVLAAYAETLCGEGYRLDTGPTLLGANGKTDERLRGGNEWVDWSRAYFHRNGVRHCQGLIALWVLHDVGPEDGGLVLIPASHNNEVETPEEVLTGADDMGLPEQPSLQAGDLLLCADALVRGMRAWHGSGPQRTLEYGFVNKHVRPHDWSNLDADDAYSWAGELTRAEQAVLHDPHRSSHPLVVQPDGEISRLEPEPEIYHPSIYIRNPEASIDDKEFYYWNLCGHLLVKGAMDAEWLAAANAAIDANPDRINTVSTEGEKDYVRLRGTHRSKLDDAWSLPQPHGEPFRRMIAHPAIIARLNWMMGSGYEVTKCEVLCSGHGGAGVHLHAGGTTQSELNHYTFRNGRCYCEYINVAWQLRDVNAADGGFCCIPGSHKTVYPMPKGVLHAADDMDMLRHVGMEAGDLLIFLAGAQTHGAFPWMGQQDRRSVLMQYRSRNLSWESASARKR
jgi:ectoine hydroxylase-related dioxygenase (phytanoyl-CoA dioxygenase family)